MRCNEHENFLLQKCMVDNTIVYLLKTAQQSTTPLSNLPDGPKPDITQPNAHGIQLNLTGQTTSLSKPQACKVCGKILLSASSYYVHMKLHSGTKPFQCTVCDVAFCRKPYLEVHMRTHTGERPFQCDLCRSLEHV